MVPFRTPLGRGDVRETFVFAEAKSRACLRGGRGGEGEGQRGDSAVTACCVAVEEGGCCVDALL